MNFEEFSQEIGQKVMKISKDAVENVQKLNEIRILTGKVNDTQKQIKAIYAEIGKKIYEQYKDAPIEGLEAELAAITEKFEEIEAFKEQVRGIKGVVVCDCCNAEVPVGEKFCSKCGNQMPEIPVEEEACETDCAEAPAEEACECDAAEAPAEDACECDAAEAPAENACECDAAEAPAEEACECGCTEDKAE